MKKILLKWLKKVCFYFDVDIEIFFFTEKLIEKFQKLNLEIEIMEYQLIGCVIFHLAIKFLEDENEITIDDWCEISNFSFNREEFIKMERQVLKILDYDLNLLEP